MSTNAISNKSAGTPGLPPSLKMTEFVTGRAVGSPGDFGVTPPTTELSEDQRIKAAVQAALAEQQRAGAPAASAAPVVETSQPPAWYSAHSKELALMLIAGTMAYYDHVSLDGAISMPAQTLMTISAVSMLSGDEVLKQAAPSMVAWGVDASGRPVPTRTTNTVVASGTVASSAIAAHVSPRPIPPPAMSPVVASGPYYRLVTAS